MNYQQTLEWLYEKLPMFQRAGASAYKENLNNIKFLTAQLGNPQKKYPAIHIAGTNGKGSTSHMLASVLQEAGYKTGLTTSPHLKDFRERIRVNGMMCSKGFVIDFVEKNKNLIESVEASFFEVSIAMAFEYFAQEKVDIAVIETGLGGRLDSTNIIHPVLSVITNIGLEHTQFLGNTLAAIAGEKAGIIKKNTPVVIGETEDETRPVFLQKVKAAHSEIIFAEEKTFGYYESDLKGFYQEKNRRTALSAIEVLQQKGFKITEEHIRAGLKDVVKNTWLRGRWEILQQNPLVIADTAHNVHGLKEAIKQIHATPHKQLHLVLGFVNDKDVKSILKLFPQDAYFYFSAPDIPRKLPIEELKSIIPPEINATFFGSVRDALEKAKTNAGQQDLIYVGGSTFVVAEVLDE